MPIQTTSRCTWTVPSQSKPGVLHLVKRVNGELSCTCDGDYFRGRCQHVAAVKASLTPAPTTSGPTAALFMAPRHRTA